LPLTSLHQHAFRFPSLARVDTSCILMPFERVVPLNGRIDG
jgi:hypothetical protein